MHLSPKPKSWKNFDNKLNRYELPFPDRDIPIFLLWSVYVLLWTFLSSQTRWTYLNIKSSEIRLTFTERCTALSDEGSNLKTRTVLPVNHGISVEVECEVGYSLSGNREITCNKDKIWKYEGDSPHCTPRGFLQSTDWPKSCDPNVWPYNSGICCPLEPTLGKHNVTVNHSRIYKSK